MEKKTIRVLLVDDEEEIYYWIKDLLDDAEVIGWISNILCNSEAASFELEHIKTFEQSLKKIKQSKHHIYLIDYQLGEENGLDLLHSAIASGCKAPIIMLTGKGDPSIDQTAMKYGAADYLNKHNLSAELLERTIRYALGRKLMKEKSDKLVTELQTALENVKKLSGLLPICSSCKKIRDDKGYWNEVEEFITEHSEADFSHGLCPGCAKKLYPDLFTDSKTE